MEHNTLELDFFDIALLTYLHIQSCIITSCYTTLCE